MPVQHTSSKPHVLNDNDLMNGSCWRLTVIDGDSMFAVEGSDDLFADGLDPLEFANVWVDIHASLMTLPVVAPAEELNSYEAAEAGARKLVINHQSVTLDPPEETVAGIHEAQSVYDGPVVWARDMMDVDW